MHLYFSSQIEYVVVDRISHAMFRVSRACLDCIFACDALAIFFKHELGHAYLLTSLLFWHGVRCKYFHALAYRMRVNAIMTACLLCG